MTRPVLVTLAVLGLAVEAVSSALDPLAGIVRTNVIPVREREDPIVEAIAVALLLGVVIVVGTLAEHTPADGRVLEQFHRAVESIPGVGPVYRGFPWMSEVLIESDTDSFREVKLVNSRPRGRTRSRSSPPTRRGRLKTRRATRG